MNENQEKLSSEKLEDVTGGVTVRRENEPDDRLERPEIAPVYLKSNVTNDNLKFNGTDNNKKCYDRKS